MATLKRRMALVLVIALLFSLVPATGVRALHQFLWWDEDLMDFKQFGPNAELRIYGGAMEYVATCSQDGIPDWIWPWTDIYIVPSGSVAFGSDLEDVSGTPNTVQSMAASGVFMDELVGYAAPTGQIGPGTYAVVYDECQDGKFGIEDKLFDPAIEIVAPTTDVPPLPGIAAMKEKAGEEKEKWEAFKEQMEKLFESATAADVGNQQSQFLWGLTKSGLTVDPRKGTLIQMGNKAKHYEGIEADPPDPAFQQVTPMAPRAIIDPLGNDPLQVAAAMLGTISSAEAGAAEALLHSLERYQGADGANDADWALVHAWAIQDYANQLGLQANQTSNALVDLADALNADPRPLDASAAALEAFRVRLATTGFTPQELAEAHDMGLSDAEIEQARQEFIARDFTFTRADLIARINALITTNDALDSALTGLFNNMVPIINNLQDDPNVTIFAPYPDAGGPYTGAEGSPVSFNATGSQSVSPITAFEWDMDGDGAFDDASGATPAYTFQQAFRGVVGLKVTNQDGHSNVTYAAITINEANRPPHIATYSPSPRSATLTVGQTGTFAVTASDPDGDLISVTWSLDGAVAGTGDTFSFTPTATDVGPHTLEVAVADNSPMGGTSVLRWAVQVLLPHTDAITVAPPAGQTADEGTPATFALGSFAAASPVGPFAADVDWGDGTGPTSFTMGAPGAIDPRSHTYADNGPYTVTVTVAEPGGSADTAVFQVIVGNLPPTAAFSVSPPAAAIGQAIALALTGVADPSPVDTAAGFTFAFDCGGGYSPFGPSAEAGCTAVGPGTMTVKGQIRDKDGGVTEYSGTVAVSLPNRPPVAFFSPDGSGRNVALSEMGATIHSSSGQYGSSYAPATLINYNNADGYWGTPNGQTAGWVKIDLAGSDSWVIDRIRIKPASNSTERVRDFAVAVSNSTAADADFTTVLTATAANNTNLQEFLLPQPVAARYVKYMPLNNRGSACCVGTAQFQAVTGQQGGPTVTFQNRSTDPDGDIAGYHWSFGDGAESTEASPTHTYAAPGAYPVTLTVTDSGGLTHSLTLEQRVLAPPAAAFTRNPANPSGEGSSVTFTDTSADPDDGFIVSRTWSWGDGSANNTTASVSIGHAFPDNSSYTVTLEVTDDQGQTAQAQATATAVNRPPTATAGSNQTVMWGFPLKVPGTASDPSAVDRLTLQCAWSFGDGGTAGPGLCSDTIIVQPTYAYPNPGTFTRTLTATDKDGASTSASSQVTVTKHRAAVAYLGPRTAGGGSPVELSAKLRDVENGQPADGRTLTFTVDGQSLTGTTGADGIARVTHPGLATGDYPVRVQFAGDAHYLTPHADEDRLMVDVAGEALVTPVADVADADLICLAQTTLTLQVTGTTPTTQNVPLDVALVIDVSGSMSGTKIVAAKDAARSFVRIMDRESDGVQDGIIRGSRVAVVPFNNAASVGLALSSNAAALDSYIAGLTASGGTAIDLGIVRGQGELAAGLKPGNKPVMILLSDGASPATPAKAAANAAKAAGTEIFSIGLGTGADEALLRDIASDPKENHYYFTPDSSQLEQIYRQIADSATGPAASNLVITAVVDPAFAITAAAIAPAPSSVIGNTVVWTLPELKGETKAFTVPIQHVTGVGTMQVVSGTVQYTDTQGLPQTRPLPGVTVQVTCPTALAYQGDLSGTQGQTAHLEARLTEPASGQPLAGKTLSFALGSITATATTDANGVARVPVTLTVPPGTYPLTVSFAGEGGYEASHAAAQFTVISGDTGPCEPLAWRSPPGGTADAALGSAVPIRFSYNACTGFVHDEQVIIVVSDKATGTNITAWVYGSDIEIDDAAEEYRVTFHSDRYLLTAGMELYMDVFIENSHVGRATIRLTP